MITAACMLLVFLVLLTGSAWPGNSWHTGRTNHGIAHLKTTSSALRQKQRPCDNKHLLGCVGNLLDKALEACPVVPAVH